jgi:hypothetical protein
VAPRVALTVALTPSGMGVASTPLAVTAWVAGDRVRSSPMSVVLAWLAVPAKSPSVEARPDTCGTPATVTVWPASALSAGSIWPPAVAEATLPGIE